ncbi:Fic family protein [Oceanivirga salmonicida]|uniref:Fic family protein n=1 Tax=Oceanivirga salmonicida TaxID=1769291 RepID=UPI0012E14CB0|nr:Fic family protein [Oceanivirga salmonicida]
MLNNILQEFLQEKKMKLKGRIYHYTQINFAYNSNHIEGSSLTEEETKYIYETNSFISDKEKITKIDDIIEAKNHFKCFDYILDTINEPLSEKLIKDLHKILKTNTNDSEIDWFAVGEYKKKPNFISNLKTTSPKQVRFEMKALLDKYNEIPVKKIENIIDFHYNFETIHPFQDGNGRLIMFRQCLKNNIVPFIISEEYKLFYYRGLKKYNEDKAFLIDTCLSCQDKYKEILKKLKVGDQL